MTDKQFKVLFICTGNSARSILAEAMMNHLGNGRFQAWSAGSHPKGEVHPLALKTLADLNIPVNPPRSKSWDEFAGPSAPEFDFVFTVCDKAAGEVCPVWPGQPITAHWGMEDPAAIVGSAEQQAIPGDGCHAQAPHRTFDGSTHRVSGPNGDSTWRQANRLLNQQRSSDERSDSLHP
jgi:arsenate reductase (thioredoxin)